MQFTNLCRSSAERKTRSGTVFSPWELPVRYNASVDLHNLLDAAVARGNLEDPRSELLISLEMGEESDLTDLESDADPDVPMDGAENVARVDDASERDGTSKNRHVVARMEFDNSSGADSPSMENVASGVDGHVIVRGGVSDPDQVQKLNSKARNRQNKRAKRRDQREKLLAQAGTSVKAVATRRRAQSRQITTQFCARDSSRASTAYIGVRDRIHSPNGQVAELAKQGFKVLPWDPKNGFLLVDEQGRIFAGGASPRAPEWSQVTTDAFEAVNRARRGCQFTHNELNHRRGRFPALTKGISYGGGQRRPMLLRSSNRNAATMDAIIDDPNVRRIAGMQSKLLHTIAPKQGIYYRETLDKLIESQPELKRNFQNSDFACLSVNLGPHTVCVDHTDCVNLATGLCAITALGSFDPKKGGHLILWQLRLMLEFPPGATILIPSALLRHSNVPIQPEEERVSITQYTAGGIFRWVENGFQRNLDCAPLENAERDGQDRWERGLDRFDIYL